MMCATSAFAAGETTDHTQGPFGQGKVTFTGTITNAPCDIAQGDDNLTVNFGQISYRKLNKENGTSDMKPVVIHLQNCSFDPDTSSATDKNPAGKMSSVSVTFSSSTPTDTGKKAYENTPGSNMATGVGVQLLKNDAITVLDPVTLASTGTDSQQLQKDNNQIQLYAQLINLGGADSVTAGEINIPLNYTLTYK
ncbi:fimbrial protein [Salmonella enterica subsp. enterica serovar Newport]|nr:fimbrial protein [Salmonella enterica]